jgi:hypothetical protein
MWRCRSRGPGAWLALSRRPWLAGGAIALGALALLAVEIRWVMPHFRDSRCSKPPGRVHRCLCTSRGGSTHCSRANPCRGLLSRAPARGLGQPLAEVWPNGSPCFERPGRPALAHQFDDPLPELRRVDFPPEGNNVHGSGSISPKPIRRPPSGLPLDLDDPLARAVSSCDVQLKPSPINLALSDGAVHASAHRLASGAIETSTEC